MRREELASVMGVSLTRPAPYFCKSPRVICGAQGDQFGGLVVISAA